DRQADAALSAATTDFAETFDVDGLPAWSLTELEDDLYRTLAGLEAQAGDVDADVTAPADMAAAIVGSLQRLAHVVTEPLRALELYSVLFDAGSDSPTVPATTATRRQQAASSAALHRLVQQGAVIEAARASSQADYASQADAQTA